MREILFRGKRVDNGEWVYGYYNKLDKQDSLDKVYIIPDYASAYYSYEVIPETIGEYTGLKDKNGKKIFEGDILLVGEKRKTVEVIFMDGNFGYLYKATCVSFQYQKPEVIGTIYDGDNNV